MMVTCSCECHSRMIKNKKSHMTRNVNIQVKYNRKNLVQEVKFEAQTKKEQKHLFIIPPQKEKNCKFL